MLIFVEGGKPENQRKTLEAMERINNKLNSHMMPSGVNFHLFYPGLDWSRLIDQYIS
jgi:hypothetical protein